MARLLRLVLPGIPYHVTPRCHQRLCLVGRRGPVDGHPRARRQRIHDLGQHLLLRAVGPAQLGRHRRRPRPHRDLHQQHAGPDHRPRRGRRQYDAGDPNGIWYRFNGREVGFNLGSDGGSYTVRSGDTLQSIALQTWGDSSLWYKIAEANGLSAGSALPLCERYVPYGAPIPIRSNYIYEEREFENNARGRSEHQMVMTRLKGAYSAVEIGERKQAEGDLRRAHMAYETAITDFMHLSFAECATLDEVKAWLSDHPIEYATERFAEISRHVTEMPRSEWTRYFQSGNYLLIAFSHFSAALDQHERARFFARIAAQPAIFTNAFWGEFGKMYGALIVGGAYTPLFGKLDFFYKYEIAYVDLMSAAMLGEPLDTSIAEIDRQFVARNADMRMNDVDAYMLEGSPEHPVQFDFRKEGLLATIANTKLRVVI